MPPSYATGGEKLLLMVLWHLYVNDWDRVDINKLTEAYDAFQERFLKTLYPDPTKPALEDDIEILKNQGFVQRTVGRVMLTREGIDAALELEIHESVEGILDIIDEYFAPGGPP